MQASEAETWVTDCPLAAIQFEQHAGQRPIHPMSLLAKAYLKQYPGRVKFKLAQGGSDVGVADVAAGRVSIGNSSRDPKDSDPGGLVFNKIAKDAICVITGKARLAECEYGHLLRHFGPI